MILVKVAGLIHILNGALTRHSNILKLQFLIGHNPTYQNEIQYKMYTLLKIIM